MPRYVRERVDASVEKKMLTGLIVSDRICKELLPLINPNSLQIDLSVKIIGWVKSYYKAYEKSPGLHITDIFHKEKRKLKTALADSIELYLSTLSEAYEEQGLVNEDYLIDKSIDYIKERNLLSLSENLKSSIEAGDLAQAEKEMSSFKTTLRVTSSWFDPLTLQEINKSMDAQRDILFTFPGKMGELVGPLERGFFIGFMGPVKKGKTWMLLETAMLSALAGHRVAFISLEMKKERMNRRLYKRIASVVGGEGKVKYPCFDCLLNQEDNCNRRERTNHTKLFIDDEGTLPKFSEDLDYKVCTACRGKRNGDYVASTWWVVVERPAFNLTNVRRKIRSFAKSLGRNKIRLKCYPRFSATLSDIKTDLDILEYAEGFVPDVIIVDYADILAPERVREQTREQIDETWKTLAGMAEERHCLVITASQTTKKSWEAKNVKSKDVAEDYRKIAHVDLMLSLNQTEEEKKRKRMRIGVIAHRDKDFIETKQVTILQELDAGQPLIDSDYVWED